MKVKNIFKIGALSLALASSANASDFGIGTRGPDWSDFQLDLRLGVSQRDISKDGKDSVTKITSQVTYLKYWNTLKKSESGEVGIFGQAWLPYQHIGKDGKFSEGFGDLKFGLGPRFAYGKDANLHVLTYTGPILATGNKKSEPALGTGRTDWNSGLTATFFPTKKRREELTLSFDYVDAQNDKSNSSDTLTFGALEGKFISQNVQIGLREIYTEKINGTQEGANSTSIGVAIRYLEPKRRFNVELVSDKIISTDNLPDGWNASLIFRYNFQTGKRK